MYPIGGHLQPVCYGRMMSDDVNTRLERLATLVEVPHEDDGSAAELIALMPCEPAIGEVVVACWRDSSGGELVELVRLDDGARVDDPVALREALALLAMVETLEELASFGTLDEVVRDLSTWSSGLLAPSERFDAARTGALEALERLYALAPTDVRVARTQLLDAIGAALRVLDTRWSALEQAVEAWSDALLAREGSDSPVAVEQVRGLWELLARVRRGPLSRSVATALHEAREAGIAMAASISHRS